MVGGVRSAGYGFNRIAVALGGRVATSGAAELGQ